MVLLWLQAARELVHLKQKDKAQFVLRKKRLMEKQHKELGSLLMTVERMINDVELQKQTNRVVNVLQEGNEALKQLQQEVTVDDVRRLMEESARGTS